ncbi:N-acetylglucosamine kinase [Acerihabitans arboris]|uniref:N-acetylglucosamine kinase n=1 Tax=Acerihabitans arboris TaxID=2691583 RepID=A0A845SIM8_9GAMM|nr:BadF/BadG/BcrA/BcrD ATPase family protein [Acerihabitans arboris]NDL61205.1 N-acetylglucosamine kinase [Acerihabitans arboris]
MIFLGVDGGGTKTAFVLINSEGVVLAQHETSTCYYLNVGRENSRTIITNGIVEVCRRAEIVPDIIDYSFFGLPAYGEVSADVAFLDQIPCALLSADKYRCDNDMVCGWAASLGCRDGINIVSGTGSIAYGEHNGKTSRCGGWGELFSDEGSAYWIGCNALNLFSKMSDHRLKMDILYDLIKSKYHIDVDLDINDLVFNKWQGDRTKIASVAKLAYEAAVEGDKESYKLFCTAARELAMMVDSVRKELEYSPNETALVSFTGGVFNCGDIILDPFIHELANLSGNYLVCQPKYNPSMGAAIYAAKISGNPLDGAVLNKLKIGE